MKNLKVQNKVLIGFLTVILLFIAAIGIGLKETVEIDQATSLLEERFQQIRTLEALKLKSTEMTLLFMDIIIDQDEAVSAERMQVLADLGTYITSTTPILMAAADTDFEKETTEKIIESFKKMLTIGRDELAVKINSKTVDKAFLAQMDDILDQLGEASIEQIDQVIGSISEELKEAGEGREATVKLSRMLLIGCLMIGLASSAVFGWLIISSITKPLTSTVDILKDLAQGDGDLTQRLATDRNDEFGDLASWFNEFVENVRVIIEKAQEMAGNLSSIGEEFSSTAEEISRTSSDIASGVEREAAALVEASAAIGQISAAFGSTASQMEELKKFASDASASTTTGNQSVTLTQEAMEAIDQSSSKMVGVVNVITDLANQTNLLSLNAAIEAAKAGDQGKGFAVVAEEVRSLADRSNVQVDQIKDLIDVSSLNVSQGKEVSGQMVQVLEEITTSVGLMSGPITATAGAITEQQLGLSELAKTTEEITQVSEANSSAAQQLAATTGQISATAAEMARTVDDLKQEVDRFRT